MRELRGSLAKGTLTFHVLRFTFYVSPSEHLINVILRGRGAAEELVDGVLRSRTCDGRTILGDRRILGGWRDRAAASVAAEEMVDGVL